MSVLGFERVEKSYDGLRAVDGVSFEVRSGEIFGLLGPNGAGKTTLIRMLMDILRPDSGRILLDGRPTWAANKDRIGYLPEERGLLEGFKGAGKIVIPSSTRMGLVEAVGDRIALIDRGKLISTDCCARSAESIRATACSSAARRTGDPSRRSRRREGTAPGPA